MSCNANFPKIIIQSPTHRLFTLKDIAFGTYFRFPHGCGEVFMRLSEETSRYSHGPGYGRVVRYINLSSGNPGACNESEPIIPLILKSATFEQQ